MPLLYTFFRLLFPECPYIENCNLRESDIEKDEDESKIDTIRLCESSKYKGCQEYQKIVAAKRQLLELLAISRTIDFPRR